MSTEKITLHVERSDDGETEFARVADILDNLATQYAWEPNVCAWLTVAVCELRQIDKIYENKSITMTEVAEHLRSNPQGCEFGRGCDVCVAAGRFS